MTLLGAVQRGLPLLSALPQGWPVMIIDIKDCFFSIPLHPHDRPRFAFTIPSLNHVEPDSRYQWKVLPQGMANSPTMCQFYVQQAIAPVRTRFSQIYFVHYIDDILLSHSSFEVLKRAYAYLVVLLKQWGLQLAADKIQCSHVGEFLRSVVYPNKIRPQKIKISRGHLSTLNDFQKLLGDINWLRPFLKIPSAELKPLFDILEGDTHLTSPHTLTPAASKALLKVEQAISKAQLQWLDYNKPFQLCVFHTRNLPTAALWQDGPVLWIHPNASPVKNILWYPSAVADLAAKGLKLSVEHFGSYPGKLIIPYTMHQLQILAATTNEWAILMATFPGKVDNHYPKHSLIQFGSYHPLIFPCITSTLPLKDGLMVYTDGPRTGRGAYVVDGKVFVKDFPHSSPQLVECHVVLEVLLKFQCPLNIVSDSHYVVNALKVLEVVGLIKPSSTVSQLFCAIQDCLLQQENPFYITHI